MSASHEHPLRPVAYRALILQPDGAVKEIQPLLVANDSDAIALAKAMVNGHAVELWDGLRYIERFDVAGWGS